MCLQGGQECSLSRDCFAMNMFCYQKERNFCSSSLMCGVFCCSNKFWCVTTEVVPLFIREDPKAPYFAVCEKLKDVFCACHEDL